VLLAALVALLLGIILLGSGAARAAGPAPLVVLAGAAVVVARFYSFDSYYAPTLRRMSEGGLVAGTWIVVLVVAAVAVALISRFRPRVGMRAGALLLILCGLTALVEGAGH
jgi:hypothetical protein